MAYTQLNWQDSPSTATPVNAANLNHMEQQYANVANDIVPGATDVNAALLQRYGANDTGWLTSGVLTAATGWSIVSYRVRRIGFQVMIGFLQFTRTGADISVSAVGDIGNSIICTIASGWTASANNGSFSSAATGRLAAASLAGSGDSISLSAVSPGGNITTNESFSVSGVYWI